MTTAQQAPDRHDRILDAVLALLADHGIAGVSIRAVARHAGVAVGLVGYHYQDKTGLITAALHHIEEQDLLLVNPDPDLPPQDRLRTALHNAADPRFLTTAYLSLRLQLWSLAQTHPHYADINTRAQKRYRDGLATLLQAARPDLTPAETERRATDIDVVQNGIWLTALLGLDPPAIRRNVARCEELAFAPA
jgi:AcrR family transcriptional regulator